MEIIYKGNTVKFEDPHAKLTVLLRGKEYNVLWGRRESEPGDLPTFPYIAENLLEAGLFEGFKHQYVPILAESYSSPDSRK